MAARFGASKGLPLIKKAWNEIPEVVCSVGLVVLALGLTVVGGIRYCRDPEAAHQHKFVYTVVRTSDVDPTKKIYN